MRQPQRGRLREPDPLRRLDAAMTGDDGHVVGDQHRVHKAEAPDAVGDLLDLPPRMGAGVVGVRRQPRQRDHLDLRVREDARVIPRGLKGRLAPCHLICSFVGVLTSNAR